VQVAGLFKKMPIDCLEKQHDGFVIILGRNQKSLDPAFLIDQQKHGFFHVGLVADQAGHAIKLVKFASKIEIPDHCCYAPHTAYRSNNDEFRFRN
jgi:hypothetical protein